MRTSVIASLAILLVAALLGWRGQQRLHGEQAAHRALLQQAAELGIDPLDPASRNTTTRGADRKAARTRRDLEIRAFASDLAAFAREMKAREGNKASEPDPRFHSRVLALLDGLLAMDDDDIKVLIDELRQTKDLDDKTRRGILMISVSLLAENHPATAVRLFTESSDLIDEDGKINRGMLSNSVRRWAEQNPAGATAWLRETLSRRPELVDDETKIALTVGLGRKDPRAALRMLGDLTVENPAAATREMASNAKTAEERTTLLAALREHDSDQPGHQNPLARSALERMARPLSEEGFASASKWLADASLTPEETAAFANGLHAHATKADTGQWVEWLGSNLSANDATAAVGRLVGQWSASDYRAAGDWLNRSPDGPTKPAAVTAYATTVAPHDPQSAAQWALTLPAGPDRDQLLRKVHQSWQSQDPQAAADFAREHDIETPAQAPP